MISPLPRLRARIALLRSTDRWPLPRRKHDPESERMRRVEAAIASLPSQTREVFMLHRFEDLSYIRIGQRLDLSVTDVEHHIAKALLHLCHELRDMA